ncbi:hypothetical protein [Luteimonas sp. A649]
MSDLVWSRRHVRARSRHSGIDTQQRHVHATFVDCQLGRAVAIPHARQAGWIDSTPLPVDESLSLAVTIPMYEVIARNIEARLPAPVSLRLWVAFG